MADPTAPPVTTNQLRLTIGRDQYIRLTDNNNDSVAEDAINNSRIYIKSKFDKDDLTFDETEAYTASAVINMAAYFLFYRNNQVKAANHYQKKAKELLKSVLGNDALGGSGEDLPSNPGASVATGASYVYGDEYGCGSYGPENDY